MAVDIGEKPEKRCAIHGIGIISAPGHLNVKIQSKGVPVLFYHVNHAAHRVVQILILICIRVGITDDNRIGKLIVGQDIPVPIINVAAGCCYRQFPADLELKIIKILLPIHNLQREQAGNQSSADDDKNCAKNPDADIQTPE